MQDIDVKENGTFWELPSNSIWLGHRERGKREKEQGLDMESFVSHALESGLHPEGNARATGKPWSNETK